MGLVCDLRETRALEIDCVISHAVASKMNMLSPVYGYSLGLDLRVSLGCMYE